MHRQLWTIAILALLPLLLAAWAFAEARRDPVVRTAHVALPHWPAGARGVTVALLGDIHIGTAAMDAGRLNRIVDQVNARHPDMVLIGGDFISGHQPGSAGRIGAAMVGPLSRLKAPLGKVAVLGNHDNWTGAGAVRAQLARAGFTVLENQVMRAGPLALGVIGDRFSDRNREAQTMAALERVPGGRIFGRA